MLQNEVFEDVFFFFSSFLKQQLVQESLEILQKKNPQNIARPPWQSCNLGKFPQYQLASTFSFKSYFFTGSVLMQL